MRGISNKKCISAKITKYIKNPVQKPTNPPGVSDALEITYTHCYSKPSISCGLSELLDVCFLLELRLLLTFFAFIRLFFSLASTQV